MERMRSIVRMRGSGDDIVGRSKDEMSPRSVRVRRSPNVEARGGAILSVFYMRTI